MGINTTEQFNELPDQAGPSRLVAGAETRAVIAVKLLVEENAVLPMRVSLEFLLTTVHRAPPGFIPQEYLAQSIRDFSS